jgi:hypothetical protein
MEELIDKFSGNSAELVQALLGDIERADRKRDEKRNEQLR